MNNKNGGIEERHPALLFLVNTDHGVLQGGLVYFQAADFLRGSGTALQGNEQ